MYCTKKNSNSKLSLNEFMKTFKKLSSNKDNFIKISNEEASISFKNLTKNLYDLGQKLREDLNFSLSTKTQPKPIEELLIENFDNEQVWQQLEILNNSLIDHSVSELSKLLSSKRPLSLNLKMNEIKPKSNKKSLKKSISEMETEIKPSSQKKVKFTDESDKEISVKKDEDEKKIDFFDLDEMEQFLDDQDYLEMHKEELNHNDDDDAIDYFNDIPSDKEESGDEEKDDSGENAMYSDFFDPPKSMNSKQKNEYIDEEEDGLVDFDARDYDLNNASESELNGSSEDEEIFIEKKLKALAKNDQDSEDNEGKSEYEKSQQKLKRKIEKAEEDLLMPHNVRWQFSGETSGGARPSNSLLEEFLQFDHVSRPVPLITNETTSNIESIIKQRIKDKVFDDVERKIKPKEQPFEFRRRVMLESEKSKVGLAEIYEQEYLKQQQKQKELDSRFDGFVAVGEAEESETRKEIRRSIRILFRKLDSLSAFHYTPRPPEPEVKIINNLPAITVEEAIPDAVNDMKLLAPEEVFSTRNKKVLQDKSERTKTDKNRARRLKKKKQGLKQKVVQNSMRMKISKDSAKKSMLEAAQDQKSLSSSTKFFQRLQEKNEMEKNGKSKPKLKKHP